MNNEDLIKFRQNFCEKAAELGIKPSELLAFHKTANTKQADWLDNLKSALGLGIKVPWYAGLGLLAGGAALGGLAGYGINQARKVVDPDDDLFGDEEEPIEDAKKIQLIARYRNAIEQAKNIQ